MSENPFYTLPLYSKYYLYCIIAYMKEEMVDTTYGDVIIKFPYLSLEFLHYYAMIIYQYSTGRVAILEVVLLFWWQIPW
ncbi:hypothetical protein COE20_23535 [Bacillus cereus]|nr:hypothetical protein CON03_00625 [Bacillus cereus]PEC55921.1 hypothetical protein CON05_07445 [Bacillus cereus]PFE46395.1 hypothetical protein CN317_15780 [Bacillus cereus]PFN13380.1 hypothetical protein COJ72_22585 [Bacillus cereus]PFO68085.1 hypothetical protein COJ86_20020 [Bacillus cereus]